MTKEEKRAKRKQDRGIVDFLMVQNHFFKELGKWIEEMKDPRNASYTTYKQTDLVYMGILKNVCSIESMRQMEEKFNESVCADTLRFISGNKKLEEVPHCDTLNYYLVIPPATFEPPVRTFGATIPYNGKRDMELLKQEKDGFIVTEDIR